MCQLGVVRTQEAADVCEGILLGRHCAAVRVGEHLASNIDCRSILISGFAAPDELRVLGETAGIDIKRNTGASRDPADFANVGHRNWLATAGIVGHSDHDYRNSLRLIACDEFFQCRDIHVALEWELGFEVAGLATGQIYRIAAKKFDVCPGCIKMGVVRNNGIHLHHYAEQNVLGRTPLMGWDNLLETENVFYRVAEAIPASSTCI